MMIDRLEPRLQFATLSGTVFNDADRSHMLETGEAPFQSQTVFIDANTNGVFDAGEQSTTTDSDGRYTFSDLADGDYTIGTTVDSTTTYVSTTATADGTKKGRFDITITGLDDATPAVKTAFQLAKDKWEAILTGDMPDVALSGGKTIDDLQISAVIGAIDGFGSILGYAGPTAARTADGIPYAGAMRFDKSDLAQLQADNQLNDVILHEMGHVLGFGTIWTAKGLAVGLNSRQPRYVGANAVREYNNLFATGSSISLSIPIENTGSDGTRNSHWRENVLHEELMTGYEGTTVDGGVDSDGNPILVPLSRITVGQFEDEGYEVNYDAADEWNPATHKVTKTVGTDYGAVANERTITLDDADDVTDLDFGYITATTPKIKSFTISPGPAVTPGFPIILSARGITDADQDELSNVSFWKETNGIEGLQRDGDTRLGNRTVSKGGAFKIQVGTTGLTGDQQYYAVATDVEGRSGRRTGTVFVGEPAVPVTTPSGLAVRRRSSTAVRFAFVDPDTDVLGYRIELAQTPTFSSESLVRTFNIASDTTAVNIKGLSPGQTYYIHVRAYNANGVTPYSPYVSFELV